MHLAAARHKWVNVLTYALCPTHTHARTHTHTHITHTHTHTHTHNTHTHTHRVTSEDIRIRMRDSFGSSSCFVPSVGSSSAFAIRHYCGQVTYDLYSLLNANADTIADDIIATFSSKVCV